MWNKNVRKDKLRPGDLWYLLKLIERKDNSLSMVLEGPSQIRSKPLWEHNSRVREDKRSRALNHHPFESVQSAKRLQFGKGSRRR